MKKIIKGILRSFGVDLVKYHEAPPARKSVRTKNLTLHHTATGDYYLPTDAHQDAVANAIKGNLVFDGAIVDLAKKYIRKDTVVLDVGANFGQMSILFSDLVGAGGKVHSFEADDWVFEILKKNIAANGKQDKIVPHFGAVHNRLGEKLYFPVQDFDVFDSYGSYGIDYNAQSGRTVESLTIDSLAIQEPISFMKIDIQGGDLKAMQGAVQTIEKNRMPILFEYEFLLEDDFKMKFQDYVDFVASIHYTFEKVIYGHNFLILPK